MILTETNNLILQVTDKIAYFLTNDIQTGKDFQAFSHITEKKLSDEEIRNRALTYLYTRKISGKSMFDYYLSKTLNLAQKEIKVIEALRDAFIGVFQITKVFKTGFELYSIINERIYNVNAVGGTMTAFRGAYQGAFLYCCLCKIDDEYYVYDTRAITASDKVGGAQRYAISRIIENPDLVYYDNNDKLKEIQAQIKTFDKNFKECFKGYEVITTNKFADNVINAFNDYCESGNDEIKKMVKKGIPQPETFEYFPTKDFNFTGEDFAKKSMAGFSAQGNEYDVGIVFVKKSGLFAIPFYGTFCKLFEVEDYKTVPHFDACVNNFLNNDKIPNVILEHVAEKYPNFMERMNAILNSNFTLDTLIRRFKPHNIDKTIISPASVLYSSNVFSQIMIKEIKKEEKEAEPKVAKVGRNDPCPCGSGKKYKKCCMPKNEEIID